MERAIYLTPSATHRGLGLVCLGAGSQSGQLAPVCDRALGCHAAVLVDRGEGWLQYAGGKRRDVRRATLFWLFPGAAHSYAPSAQGWSERWLLFDGAATAAYEELGVLDRQHPASEVDPWPLARAFERLYPVCARDDDPRRDVAAAALTHQLIVTAARARDTDSDGQSRVLAELRSSAFTARSIADHARSLRMSVPELRNAVRSDAGSSPKQYLLQTRLNEAKSLLAQSDLAVARVAARVGYDDAGYFSRLFVRHVGVAPGAFRKQQRRDQSSG